MTSGDTGRHSKVRRIASREFRWLWTGYCRECAVRKRAPSRCRSIRRRVHARKRIGNDVENARAMADLELIIENHVQPLLQCWRQQRRMQDVRERLVIGDEHRV